MATTLHGPHLSDDQRKQFGASLRELRTARKLTLEAVAEQIGVTRGAVHQYEAGTSVPSLAAIAALALAYGVKPSAIVASLDPPKASSKKIAKSV